MAVDKEMRSRDCASLGGPRCAVPVCSDRLPAEEICLNEVEKFFYSFFFFHKDEMSRGDAFGCSFPFTLPLGSLTPRTVLPVPLSSPVCHTCVCDPQENHVYPHAGAFDCTSPPGLPLGKGHLIQIRSLYIVGT